uniref:Large ribosomal subunit protein bL12c n=1 Tax=Xylochloris irregularis TaxID=480381 RepID=A0A097KMB9_9CHLO|nr:ribosomal protein L12 [Xylochloris irregularis]AIT94329.1 ribosomal protein L12 [Xylochloris irregularis]
MSDITNEIIEKLKSMTLLEASELVSEIEKTFGVDASAPVSGGVISVAGGEGDAQSQAVEEKTTFDVILEAIPQDKRVPALKVLRTILSLGIKETKEFIDSLPKPLKEGVSKEEADSLQQQLEPLGAQIKIV